MIAAAFVAMTACNKSVIETAPVAEYGFINLGVTTDTEMVVTKADETTYDNYNIKLVSVSGETETSVWTEVDGVTLTDGYAEYGSVKDNADLWKVPAGNYRIYIENLTVAETYSVEEGSTQTLGQVRVADMKDVTVTAGLSTEVILECTPQNSRVSFIYTEDFDTVFDNPKVSVEESETRTVDMSVGTSHESAETAYFEAGELTWTLTAELGEEAKTYSKSFTTQVAKWSQITFTTGSTDGKISIIISVDGVIDEVIPVTATIDPIGGSVEQTEGSQNN